MGWGERERARVWYWYSLFLSYIFITGHTLEVGYNVFTLCVHLSVVCVRPSVCTLFQFDILNIYIQISIKFCICICTKNVPLWIVNG